MSRKVSRVLWIIAGVLLILAGVFCWANPGLALTTLSLYLGLSMLISGIIDLVIFAKGNRYMVGSGWFLLDGILTVLLSLFLLFHQAFTMLSLPFIFGMWLLISGINKLVNSFELRRLGVPGLGLADGAGHSAGAGGFLLLLRPGFQSACPERAGGYGAGLPGGGHDCAGLPVLPPLEMSACVQG